MVSQVTGSMKHTLAEIEEHKSKKRELSQATQRLKVLEQLEQYREEKIKKERINSS